MFLACTFVPVLSAKDAQRFVIAYVTSWSDVIPDPYAMTHINYAFGHVSESFDGIGIANPERLEKIAALHEQNKDLKILLSVGGWGSGRFSEMVSCDSTRHKFCLDARRVIEEYGLDGIDIDWEYPGEPGGGISHAPTDVDNFSKLMNELRAAIGKDKLLTLATYAEGKFYKFTDFIDAVDFVNIMTYDMASAPGHHAPLFNSGRFGGGSCEKGVRAHQAQGVPSEKICLGLPFYGRGLNGGDSNFVNYRDVGSMQDVSRMRDDVAGVPFLMDREGQVVLGYDDEISLANKCRYAKKWNLAGVMYWDYAGDDDRGTLRYAVRDAMK